MQIIYVDVSYLVYIKYRSWSLPVYSDYKTQDKKRNSLKVITNVQDKQKNDCKSRTASSYHIEASWLIYVLSIQLILI